MNQYTPFLSPAVKAPATRAVGLRGDPLRQLGLAARMGPPVSPPTGKEATS
jgi:hypothetical protein